MSPKYSLECNNTHNQRNPLFMSHVFSSVFCRFIKDAFLLYPLFEAGAKKFSEEALFETGSTGFTGW
jgi:hypothetical protein